MTVYKIFTKTMWYWYAFTLMTLLCIVDIMCYLQSTPYLSLQLCIVVLRANTPTTDQHR